MLDVFNKNFCIVAENGSGEIISSENASDVRMPNGRLAYRR